MRTSETTAGLYKALAAAQAEINDPDMGGEGQVGGKRRDGTETRARKYDYATLVDVLKVARAALGKHQLCFSQVIDLEKGAMITRIMHSSGEWMEGHYPMAPKNNDPQKQGSANTYARRYALMSILGIAGDKDDDGEAARPLGPASRAEIDEARKSGVEEGEKRGKQLGKVEIIAAILAPAVDGYNGRVFAGELKKADIPHEMSHVRLFCMWAGMPKPSRMDDGMRARVVRRLGGESGAKKWAEFVKECGPLPVPKKRAAKPKAAKWTKSQEAAYLARVAELDWKPEEIEGYQTAQGTTLSAEMSETGRAALLEALADTGEGSEGKTLGDHIAEWLSTQGSSDGEE